LGTRCFRVRWSLLSGRRFQ